MVTIYEITYVLPVYSSTILFINYLSTSITSYFKNWKWVPPNISVLCRCFLNCQSLAGKKNDTVLNYPTLSSYSVRYPIFITSRYLNTEQITGQQSSKHLLALKFLDHGGFESCCWGKNSQLKLLQRFHLHTHIDEQYIQLTALKTKQKWVFNYCFR